MAQEKHPNWGGKRPGAGPKRKYIRVQKKFYVERSERMQLTPDSDLSICLAEIEVDENVIRRGVVIDDIWYGAAEALAIARFLNRPSKKQWLSE